MFLKFSNLFSVDYILEFQANVKIIKEYNISKTEKFRSYELEGTFTDQYGNYGKFDGIVTSDVKHAFATNFLLTSNLHNSIIK